MKTMDEIRVGVLRRIKQLADARDSLNQATDALQVAAGLLGTAWEGWGGESEAMQAWHRRQKVGGCNALHLLIEREAERLTEDIMASVEQFASLFVRDVIKPLTEDSSEPFVTLTGNAFVPAIRSFDEADELWLTDDKGDIFERFHEAFENECDKLNVEIIYPENDNCMLAVGQGWHYNGPRFDVDAYFDHKFWSRVRD